MTFRIFSLVVNHCFTLFVIIQGHKLYFTFNEIFATRSNPSYCRLWIVCCDSSVPVVVYSNWISCQRPRSHVQGMQRHFKILISTATWTWQKTPWCLREQFYSQILIMLFGVALVVLKIVLRACVGWWLLMINNQFWKLQFIEKM